MGFFNKILKGLGFEDEEKQEKNTKEVVKNSKPVNATYNFDKKEKKDKKIKNEKVEIEKEENFSTKNNFSIDVVKINNQNEVQNVIERVKYGEKLIVNFSELDDEEIVRCLDFLSGAVYVLEKSIKKIESYIFLVE